MEILGGFCLWVFAVAGLFVLYKVTKRWDAKRFPPKQAPEQPRPAARPRPAVRPPDIPGIITPDSPPGHR